MRAWAALMTVCALAGSAHARPDRDFWTWLIEPHAAAVDTTLEKMVANRHRADDYYAPWEGWVLHRSYLVNRRALFADNVEMARYALGLSPDRPALWRELGHALFETGDATEAARAFQRYLELEEPDRIHGEARTALAGIRAAEGRLDEARTLAIAALAGRFESADRSRSQATLQLATLLMAGGRTPEAIDLLRGQQAAQGLVPGAFSPSASLLLAMAYDRDEQLHKSRDILEQLRFLGNEVVFDALADARAAPLRLVPLCDRHYLQGLAFQATDELAAARAEWQSYLDCGKPRFESRARDHLAEIDAMLNP